MFSLDQYGALRTGAGLVDRSARGRLRLTGVDRRTYLQGLLTNDIVALEPGGGCYAAYLTPQGRMIADARVFETGDALLVDLPGDVAAAVRDRWTQFIFSEDVQISDLTAATSEIGVYGPRAGQVLEDAFAAARVRDEPFPSAALLGSMPLNSNGQWNFRGAPAFLLCSDDIGVMGFDVVVEVEAADALVDLLRQSGGLIVQAEAAEACRIEAGRPVFHLDMDEDTIPLEAGIEDRAISLTKGCYVGQEIIIRVLHRGHGRVAKRLMGLTFDSSAAVRSRGDRVQVAEREIGVITSATRSPSLGRPIALAYVHRDFVAPGTVVSVAGTPATVSALPFV
jgi:tRNA-modifying protein YgfZ